MIAFHRMKDSWLYLLIFLTSRSNQLVVVTASSTTTSTTSSSIGSSSPTLSSKLKRKLVIGIDGGTESIRACCFDALDGHIVGQACATPYVTYHPKPGWAEQHPEDWYTCMVHSVRRAVQSIIISSKQKEEQEQEDYEICAICMDTTCCSVVALDQNYQPLRPALLWMDARSAPQAITILRTCRGDPALEVNCGGEGPLSAEWMTPKALWIHDEEFDSTWSQAHVICEYQDYMNYKLTQQMVASSCNAATRWHWNGDECITVVDGNNNSNSSSADPQQNKYPGRPMSLYNKLGIPDLAEKLPQKCLPMGAVVGHLTTQAASDLHLKEGVPVVQGGADAFVGMIGLGCIEPGQLCLITGSSHLHCVVTSQPSTAPGTWGAYRGAPLQGMNFAEGGQSSTGSIVRWAKHELFEGNNGGKYEVSYKELDDAASKVPPGSDGLVALETFQGSRTPMTDPLARGALMGLTLSHTRAHIWRALLEGVCFGTKACIDGLAKAGHEADEIIIAGGATRSPLWLQMHADVTGLPVIVCENEDAPLLGCAILASVGVGIHKDVEGAVKAMVRQAKRVEPNQHVKERYAKLYSQVYSKVSEAARPVAHAIASLRGGSEDGVSPTTPPRTNKRVIISPSILAADWADVKVEIQRCVAAGATQIHVDIFDGVFLDSPLALTFGPKMVQDIRKSCSKEVILDLHICVDRPERYVSAMAQAGGNRFIFQWEAMFDGGNAVSEQNAMALYRAIQLSKEAQASGMQCGISINPGTDLDGVYPLLQTGLIDLVDILAVEPGFGGQTFQTKVLTKIEELRRWRSQQAVDFDILVDGGINSKTAAAVIKAGADILVAGTFLFQHPTSMQDGLSDLLQTVPTRTR